MAQMFRLNARPILIIPSHFVQAFVISLRQADLRAHVTQQYYLKNGISPTVAGTGSSKPHKDDTSTSPTHSSAKPIIMVKPAAEVQPVPASFPSIQPIKAARLFECDSSDLGSWQIYFSSRSISQFRQLDKSTMLIVVKKVKELSTGHFSPDNQVSQHLPIFNHLADQRICCYGMDRKR
jgi:hypothetical protein